MEVPKPTFVQKIQKIGALVNKDLVINHGHVEVIEEAAADQKKHGTRNLINLFALPALIILVLGWVMAGTYLQKVQLGDNTVSLHQSDASLQQLVEKQAENYALTINYPDGSKKSFSLAATGLGIDAPASVKAIRTQQNRLGQRLQWWRVRDPYLVVTKDILKLNSFVTQQATITIQPAQDATLSIEHGKVHGEHGDG